MVIDDSGNKNWLPGIPQKERYLLELPSSMQKGKYTLKFKLVDLSTDKPGEVKTGLQETLIDVDNFVNIEEISLTLYKEN